MTCAVALCTPPPVSPVATLSYPQVPLLLLYPGIEEAKKRDHRNVGVHQELFFFHHLSPGSAFFLPHGGRIYNALIEYMREKYWEYEYDEVKSGKEPGCMVAPDLLIHIPNHPT